MTDTPARHVCHHIRSDASVRATVIVTAQSIKGRSRAELNETIDVCGICAGELVLLLTSLTTSLTTSKEI